ncbi:hypothetical protein OH77DRAFT_1422520 [Trametes cingulata]|nr:hypothetical protein OH77DRAFT_1422520 [Trametes cingulata]
MSAFLYARTLTMLRLDTKTSGFRTSHTSCNISTNAQRAQFCLYSDTARSTA